MANDLDTSTGATAAALAPVVHQTLPERFTTVEQEWATVRQRSGLLDAGFRGLLRLAGTDRVSFLQGMLSNDVARLQPGQGTYAALLTQQGKIVSDVRVYVLTDEMWLDVPATRVAAVRESLERYIIADDVEFVDAPCWQPLVAVEGPQAGRVILAVTGEAADDLVPFAHREFTFDGSHVRITAVSHTGERGYLICGDAAPAARLWEQCHAAGAEPVGMETLDVLRIEAGIPWHGRDMDDSTLIAEAGLDAAISYKKGCYLGQEVVERVAARGQVHRKLVGLVCEGRRVPSADAKLMSGGKEVGWITSATWSIARSAVIALGYVRREHWEPGSEVQVVLPDGTLAAHVAGLPFYEAH